LETEDDEEICIIGDRRTNGDDRRDDRPEARRGMGLLSIDEFDDNSHIDRQLQAYIEDGAIAVSPLIVKQN